MRAKHRLKQTSAVLRRSGAEHCKPSTNQNRMPSSSFHNTRPPFQGVLDLYIHAVLFKIDSHSASSLTSQRTAAAAILNLMRSVEFASCPASP
jgi:hypothetical protein